ncbi:hypothetical protein ACIQNI_08845 [Streptomyces sp. NPDC091266]|uniref:hypothetical protein n=1 Tax=Streptomyces sp. NPDC091266 TaxID=3365978 RepID=UPI003804A92F
MATPNPIEPARSQPPAVGKSASVRVDQPLHDDLAVVMRCGVTASDAIRRAVEVLADVYRGAWDVAGYPDGVAPLIESANLAPYDAVRRAEQRV